MTIVSKNLTQVNRDYRLVDIKSLLQNSLKNSLDLCISIMIQWVVMLFGTKVNGFTSLYMEALSKVAVMPPGRLRDYLDRLLTDVEFPSASWRALRLDYDQHEALQLYLVAPEPLKKRPPSKVMLAITQQMAAREALSVINAEYVRMLLRTVLDMCPTDYFMPAEEGGWTCAYEDFKKLPVEIKRLIESMEYRVIPTPQGPKHFLAIKLISKTTCLQMAARYALTVKHEVKIDGPTINWDQLATAAMPDSGEQRLLNLERQADEFCRAQGPSGNGSGPVA